MSRARATTGPWSEAPTLSVRGLDYRVRVAGRPGRPLVLLLHGFAGSSRDWDAMVPPLTEAEYAVMAVDLPGHGETGSPAEPWRYGAEEVCLDLTRILAEAGAASVHGAGYSMGARLALYLALAHPERVASLFLESPSPGIENASEREARRAADESLARAIETRGIEWFAEHWAGRPVFESQRRLPAETRERLRAVRLANRIEGLAGSLRGFGQGVQPWLGEHLSAVACPTLLLTGTRDEKYDALGSRMAVLMPNAEQHPIPEAGHNVHLEQPEAFTRALLAHLARSERRAAGAASWIH